MTKKIMFPLALVVLGFSNLSFCPPRPDLPGNTSSADGGRAIEYLSGRRGYWTIKRMHCCPGDVFVYLDPVAENEEPAAKQHAVEVVAGKAAVDKVASMAADLE